MSDGVLDIEQQLVERVIHFKYDPAGFVRWAFSWGEGDLEKSLGPYTWQQRINEHIRDWLANPETQHQPCQIAVASGHGIGKSAEIGMLINWAMSCWQDARVVATANTFTQLDTKTVPEVSTWFRRSITEHWFDVKQTSIKVRDKAHEKTWRADFIPWSEKNPQAFAGLHNKRRIILVIFDEASGIDDVIWETITGALSDEDTVIIWIAFGNPTKNTGRFAECFGRFKHRWFTLQIDAREVEGTNKQKIQKDIEDWGEDSDFVRVRWRGVFPRAGNNQFISSEAVERCRQYKAEGYENLPKILSVDVARFGDDQTVIGIRQGRKAQICKKLRSMDTVEVAERTIEIIDEHKPDAVVIDGDGIGAGVVDQLRHRGYTEGLFEFHGGGKPQDGNKYFNKRAEVWGLLRDAIEAGMELPNDPELIADLTNPEYGFSNKQQIQLEKKEDMKARGLSSPDCGDMLAMTFAVQVLPKAKFEQPEPDYSMGSEANWMG